MINDTGQVALRYAENAKANAMTRPQPHGDCVTMALCATEGQFRALNTYSMTYLMHGTAESWLVQCSQLSPKPMAAWWTAVAATVTHLWKKNKWKMGKLLVNHDNEVFLVIFFY